MAVRAWLGTTLLGGLLVVAAVTFFVAVAVRDAALLRNGIRVTATVVDVKPAAGWNVFDYERLVVQYPVENGEGPFTTRLPLSERQWRRWRNVEFETGPTR